MSANQIPGVVHCLAPVAVSAATNSLLVNMANYPGGGEFLVYVGAATGTPNGTNNINLQVQESADTAAANFATVAASTAAAPGRMLAQGTSDGAYFPPSVLLDSAGEFGGKVFRFPVKTSAAKPFVRMKLDVSGTISAPIAVLFVGKPAQVPAAGVVTGTSAT